MYRERGGHKLAAIAPQLCLLSVSAART